MVSSLPARPSLEWLRRSAKDRLAEIRKTRPRAKLAEAQLAVACEYGFSSWRALKAHVDSLLVVGVPALGEAGVARFLEIVGVGRLDAVRARLSHEPRLVNAVGPHPFWAGFPQPLHVAIETTRRPMVHLLLEHGADVDGANDRYDHWSPLMLAIHRGCDDIRDELVARGARVRLVEALMLADDARIEVMLERDGLPEVTPNAGSIVAFARTPVAIDRLLAVGAPVDLADRWGSKPVDALSRLGPRGVSLVRHLVSRGTAADPAAYARLGDLDVLERLVAADPAVATLDSVIMAAVDFRHHAIVDWLLDRGANPNARSGATSRHTALHAAAWNGDLRMVRILLDAGADRTLRDDQYDATPDGWAETSMEVTDSASCAEVAETLRR